MANLKITIDGQVHMDGDPGQWNNNPPPLLTEQLKAGAQPAPWMRAVLMAVADTITRQAAANNGVQLPPNRDWTMHVEHHDDDTTITITTGQP